MLRSFQSSTIELLMGALPESCTDQGRQFSISSGDFYGLFDIKDTHKSDISLHEEIYLCVYVLYLE